jgi:hypothetical protein
MSSIQIPPSVRSVFSEDGAVVMEIKQGLMYTSNPVGGRIFELLSQGQTPEQVVATVSRECDVEPAMVHRDLEGFLEELSSYGLISQDASAA